MKTLVMHSSMLAELKRQVIKDEHVGLYQGDLQGTGTFGDSDPMQFNSLKILTSNYMAKFVDCRKKQDRRKNKRIQARLRSRRARAPSLSNNTVYTIDMEKMYAQLKGQTMLPIPHLQSRGWIL